MKLEVEAIFNQSRQTYGYWRTTKTLSGKGIRVNEKVFLRIMEERNLKPKARRKYKSTTLSKHSFPVAENLMDRNYSAAEANQKWSQDIIRWCAA